MMIDFFNLEVPERLSSTVEFEDPQHGKQSFKIVGIDVVSQIEADDIADQLITTYLEPTDLGDGNVGYIPFPPVGGKIAKVNKSLCHIAAALSVQVVEPKMEAVQFIAMSVSRPVLFQALYVKAAKLNAEAQGPNF